MSTLIQYLTRLPSQQLRARVARLFPGHAASWGRASDIVAFVVEKLLDEDFLEGLFQRMDDQQRRVVSVFVWMVGPYGIEKSRMKAWLTANVEGRPLEALAFLTASGLVFETYGDWGDYVMPEDLVDKFALIMARKSLPAPAGPDEVSENIFGGDFYEDCLTFIAYAHKNLVALTQKGYIRKKTMGKLLSVMQFREDVNNIPPNFEYPFRFWLIINYCRYINVIYFGNMAVNVEIEPVRSWLKETFQDMAVKATAFLWNVCIKSCPNAPAEALMWMILQMKENCWYGHAALARAARTMVGSSTVPGPDPEAFLDIMLGLGLLLEGVSREGERMVRWGFWSPRNKAGGFPDPPAEEDGFWVQPNFEVVTPPRLKPSLRWQLEMIAEPVKVDQSYTYAITRQAVLAFFDRGGQAAYLLHFLQKHSKNSLPQNVVYTVKEWDALYGRISFWDVFLLRCDDEHLADEISAHPKLKPYIRGRFDQNHLIISRDQYEPLLGALQKQGYFPRKGVVRGEVADRL